MRLVRFDPFRDATNTQDMLSRLLGGMAHQTGGDETTWGAWAPAVDIFEKDDCLVFKAELPGMKEKDIDAHVENGILTLRGERMREEDVTNESYHRVERYHGSFSRTFALPTTVDVPKIRASYKDGILELVLPKAETAKAKRIEIKAA
jgi:HSP20 family protein